MEVLNMSEETKLAKDVEAMVTKIFAEKEDADVRKKTEEALSRSAKTIEDLTTSVETKDEEMAELATKVAEGEDSVKELTTKLEAAESEVKSFTEKLATSEKALEDMKKDKLADERITELEAASVANDADAQREQVKEMSDDEFASYKKDRISLRQSVLDQIKETEKAEKEKADKAEADEKAKADADTDSEGEEKAGDGEDGDEKETTQPANVDPGTAVSAALNMEVIAPKDVVAKYAELGQSMADAMTKKEQ
jgi:chromosome segregation ATPase